MLSDDVGYRVGVDVGGTFTDLVLVAPDGTTMIRKVLSTSDDYSRGIIAGLREMLASSGAAGAQVSEVLHGTTVATNTVLERKGAKTGLLTTAGFRDVLEIGRLRTAALYDLDFERPTPLVPRRWRREIPERMDRNGRPVRDVDHAAVDRALDLLLADGVEALAVSFLHSYANGEHERIVGDLVRERAPGLALTLSSDLLPEIREFERTSTTVTNAYVTPVVDSYLGSLEKGLDELGVRAPLLIMQSHGGVMAANEARRAPVHIIESGPAAGVIAAAGLARRTDHRNVISVDMGGTTAKAAVIEDGHVSRTGEFEIGGSLSQVSRLNKGSGHAIRAPAIDIAEIGAGGGSIVRVDDAGQLHVGPQSAGAVPGPACYGQGGTEATLTDANVVLGILPGDRLPSGLELDSASARETIRSAVADPLGLDPHDAAHGVFRVGSARMTRAVRAVTVERGRDPREFMLVAFGGNGPVFAAEIADGLGIDTVVVPSAPGVFSAVGLLEADLEHHAVQSYIQSLTEDAVSTVLDKFDEMAKHAKAVVGGGGDAPVSQERFVDLKYVGQSFELPVRLADDGDGSVGDASAASLAARFAAEHRRTYGHAPADDPIQVVNLRLVTRVLTDAARLPGPPALSARPGGTSRDAYFGADGGITATPVVGRGDLTSTPRPGPLLIDEYDTTVRVPPLWDAHVNDHGDIVLQRNEGR